MTTRHNTPKFKLSVVFALFMAATIFISPPVQAEIATDVEMEQVSQNWLNLIISEKGDWAGSSTADIIDVQDIIEDDTVLARYYAISSGGYIIVPTLKELPPVKAYSDENYLDIHEADGVALMLRQVLKQRFQLFVEVYGSLEATQPLNQAPLFDFGNREKWDVFAVSPDRFTLNADKNGMEPLADVGPLLTTTWHQGAPYNNLAPMGDGGRTDAGCVAIAAAQLMWYHQWPPMGEGSHSYYWSGDHSCGNSTPGQNLSVDFSDSYLYDGSAASVAEICYETAVAFEMDWGNCGSGAYTMYGAVVYPAYFRYDESATVRYRDNYDPLSWFGLVQGQINQGLPTLYRIYSHAIVCDGWRVAGMLDQYHFNYGWGGSQNLWYSVDGLYCPWSGCNPMVESMVINIIPKTAMLFIGGNEVTDDLFGDGDGIPEAGETISMVVTVANFGVEPLSDVSVELLIDDGSIIINDGAAYLGYIPARDSVDNSSDPFEFEIPADYASRIDSFFVVATYNSGQNCDTLVFEKNIGQVTILLVDDDENGAIDGFYESCFENYRIPYDVWIHSAYASPDSDYLGQYENVLWFTGDYRASPLNSDEISAMKGYMDAGGNLFLSGQGIAAQLDSYDPTFLSDYLKSEYLSTMYIPILGAEPGCQTLNLSDSVAIQGNSGASNQINPDFISPINGGNPEMCYYGQTGLGAISYSGSYKLVFFSFGFEAIINDDSRWTARNEVLTRILDFFAYSQPNQRPQVTGLTCDPGPADHMIDHTPDFNWTYFDPESNPQLMFQLQVGTSDDWSIVENWDYGPVAGSDAGLTYDGTELLDGTDYTIRVRTHNGYFWSDWRSAQFRMNSLPPPPTGLVPDNMAGTADNAPDLTIDNSFDAEYDPITYSFEVYDDVSLTNLVASVSGLTEGSGGNTTWKVSSILSDDQEYFWRVQPSDFFESGLWSDPASFWVNSNNQLPTGFNLIEPANETGIGDLMPSFTWESSGDLDLHDSVTYILYYDTDPLFSSPVYSSGISDTQFTITTELELSQTYYWEVKAIDLFSGETVCSDAYMLMTMIAGDANGDMSVNLGDAGFIINYIFYDGPAPSPLALGDANCDQGTNLGDAGFIINYIFYDGPEPGCN